MKIQWYPGHMTKARRAMQEDVKLVDLVIELLDARAPGSSRNPDIDTLAKGKFRLVLLNKADLADEQVTDAWKEYFKSAGIRAVPLDSRTTGAVREIRKIIPEICREKIERDRKRGILNRPIRAMVCGIPNVGKSTFINSFAGRAAAKTGNKPGVTRGNQWIRLDKNVELLDTPGILWPKFDDDLVGTNLAFLGSVSDDIVDKTGLAYELLMFLSDHYPDMLEKRYDLSVDNRNTEAEEGPESGSETDDPNRARTRTLQLMEEIALHRNCLKKGGEPDLDRAALLILDDFRSGRLGRITLEKP